MDIEKFSKLMYGSANSIDVGFRICIEGIEDWVGKQPAMDPEPETYAQLCVLVVDDYETNAPLKQQIRTSFRSLRKRVRQPTLDESLSSGAYHLHDDMYFGSSVDSVGIQLADLCTYFIAKHLRDPGKDLTAEDFYKVIENNIVFKRVLPE